MKHIKHYTFVIWALVFTMCTPFDPSYNPPIQCNWGGTNDLHFHSVYLWMPKECGFYEAKNLNLPFDYIYNATQSNSILSFTSVGITCTEATRSPSSNFITTSRVNSSISVPAPISYDTAMVSSTLTLQRTNITETNTNATGTLIWQKQDQYINFFPCYFEEEGTFVVRSGTRSIYVHDTFRYYRY